MAKKKFFLSSGGEEEKDTSSVKSHEKGTADSTDKIMDKRVKAEVAARYLPSGYEWAVVAGIKEASTLLEGKNIDLEAFPEGTFFKAGEPVLSVEASYLELEALKDVFTSYLCQPSGLATKAARCKKAAGNKPVYITLSGIVHPLISSLAEQSAFIGGCEKIAGRNPADAAGSSGHSGSILYGGEEAAQKAVLENSAGEEQSIILTGTFEDEKTGVIKAVEQYGDKISGIRLEIPASRNGNIVQIIDEVRWELNIRGFHEIKLFISSSLDEFGIRAIQDKADGFEAGTAVAGAPLIRFEFDIVEVESRPVSRRGKMSGSKQVWRCLSCLEDKVLPKNNHPSKCVCGKEMIPLMRKVISGGKTVSKKTLSTEEIRGYVLAQLEKFNLENG